LRDQEFENEKAKKDQTYIAQRSDGEIGKLQAQLRELENNFESIKLDNRALKEELAAHKDLAREHERRLEQAHIEGGDMKRVHGSLQD